MNSMVGAGIPTGGSKIPVPPIARNSRSSMLINNYKIG